MSSRFSSACAISLLTALTGLGASPNLSGTWEIIAARSDYGRMPAPKTHREVIEHKEPSLVITLSEEDHRGKRETYLKLTTDGRENLNEANGNEFRSKSHWDGEKLVTVVLGDKGMQMTEMRSISEGGKVQTVEMYMGEARGRPQIKIVMEKKAP